jgi:hypothetical protein
MGWDSNHDQPPPSILKVEGRLWIVDLRKKPHSPLYPQHSNIIDTKISIPKQVIFIRLPIDFDVLILLSLDDIYPSV